MPSRWRFFIIAGGKATFHYIGWEDTRRQFREIVGQKTRRLVTRDKIYLNLLNEKLRDSARLMGSIYLSPELDFSVNNKMENSSTPITGLAWISSVTLCPKTYNMIVATVEGASANFVKGFNQKSAVYLGYSTVPEGLEQVITDIQMLNEKTVLPVGYAFIGEHLDPKISVPKKKRLCVKQMPMHTAETAVCEIKLSMKSKQFGAPYERIGEISGLVFWCRKGSVSAPKPTPKPRNITSGIKGLSLDSNTAVQPVRRASAPNPDAGQAVPLSNGKWGLSENAIYDSSNIYGISAIDGIPFTIHPMFENTINNSSVAASDFRDLHIKTLSEIESEYNYGFVVEKTAAARIPPRLR
ncbi:hypothetical protein XELAEV_18039255mg [Xenopus laevis]|nr:hypothetical protein XELAEV_18039255mg [Xenopus laevis]